MNQSTHAPGSRKRGSFAWLHDAIFAQAFVTRASHCGSVGGGGLAGGFGGGSDPPHAIATVAKRATATTLEAALTARVLQHSRWVRPPETQLHGIARAGPSS